MRVSELFNTQSIKRKRNKNGRKFRRKFYSFIRKLVHCGQPAQSSGGAAVRGTEGAGGRLLALLIANSEYIDDEEEEEEW